MSEAWRSMVWAGRTTNHEMFRGPDGRVINVVIPPGTTMGQAQRLAHRQWKSK